MKERVLKWLDISEMKILKHIIIISDRQYGETELGSIFYTRPFTEDYNLKKQQEEDAISNETTIDRLLQEHPKQKNYPNDRIDEIIFESVKKNYPKSILRNDTILFNVDLEKLETLKNKLLVPSFIYFSPEFSNIGNFQEFVGKEFKAPQINLNIYSYYKPAYMDKQIFYATYNVIEENVLENLNTIKFE
jgi:hypothetical protein